MGNYFYFGIDMKCARRISISLLEFDLAEKEFSKKIPKYFLFQPLVFPGSFQNMGKQQTWVIRVIFNSYFLLYLWYTNMPRLTKRFEIMVTATRRKNLGPSGKTVDLQCQNITMTQVFMKTKSRTQHALFCVLLNWCCE